MKKSFYLFVIGAGLVLMLASCSSTNQSGSAAESNSAARSQSLYGGGTGGYGGHGYQTLEQAA